MGLGGMASPQDLSCVPHSAWSVAGTFFFFFFERVKIGEPREGSRSECGKGSRGTGFVPPEVQLVKEVRAWQSCGMRGAFLLGVSGLREVRVWSDEEERPAPWTAPGLHTASLCQSLVGGWAGQGPGPSPASPGGSASSTAPGLGHRPASTVLRPSPFSLS